MAEIAPFHHAKRRPRASASDADTGRPGGERDSGWIAAARDAGPVLWAAPAALFLAVFLAGQPTLAASDWFVPAPAQPDTQAASFNLCDRGVRYNCVIDGDTFWYRGEKIRVADINAPETHEPGCDSEAKLGARATRRFQALLNAGPFTLKPIDRAQDQYGRALFTVTRKGASLGEVLVTEGLAEEWQGYRGEWC